jgi:hypothetical protein
MATAGSTELMEATPDQEKSVTLILRDWQLVAAALVAVETFEGPKSPGKLWNIKDNIEKQLGLKLSNLSRLQ